MRKSEDPCDLRTFSIYAKGYIYGTLGRIFDCR